MRYFSKRHSFLILKLHLDSIADIVLGLLVVLNLAAGPICVNLDPEVLVLLEVVIDLKGKVVLGVPKQNLEKLIIAHESQLFIGDVSHPFSEEVTDPEKFGGLVDVVIVD